MAQLRGIYLRTGCFCNPGACQRQLRLSNDELKQHFQVCVIYSMRNALIESLKAHSIQLFLQAGHICGDGNDLIDGTPTGAVRISMGYMTTKENVDAIIQLIRDCFCNKKYVIRKEKSEKSTEIKIENKSKERFSGSIKLREICVFPVKSCGAFRVDTSWTINRRGLKYDREWMIVSSNGAAMTQKTDTRLCLIQPVIDEARNVMELRFRDANPFSVPLHVDMGDNKTVSSLCQSKVCGDRVDGIDCGDGVAEWLSNILGTNGLRLIRQNENDKRAAKTKSETKKHAISLSNQAQFLLINTTSVDWLAKRVDDWSEFDDCSEKILQNTIDRFRGNLIIESTEPLEEVRWQSIRFGDDIRLQVTGPCTRCQMICIDQSTGEKTSEPLRTISREFQGKMRFGIYLSQSTADESDLEQEISCDCKVYIES